MDITTIIKTKTRPTISSSTSVACLRILVQMSMVKMVEEELKMEVREDMRAANITASISPDSPVSDTISVTADEVGTVMFCYCLIISPALVGKEKFILKVLPSVIQQILICS